MTQEQQPPQDDLMAQVKKLLNEGNARKLELRQPSGQKVFGLPLSWAVVLGLLALVAQLLVPLVIAVVVLLILKFRFALTRDTPPQPSQDDLSPPA